MKKTKIKGFMTLQGVLMVVLLGLLALSFLQIYGSQFSALTANRRALQAQQFAQSEADFLRNTSYDELDTTAHARQAIAGTNGWTSEVSLAAETTVNGVQQRLGTIKVYRNSSVSAPDFSLQVPLTSQGSSDKSSDFDNGWVKFPNKLILQWGTSHVGYKMTTRINFQKEFPNKCLVVIGSDTGTWSGHKGSECDVSFHSYDKKGFFMTGLDNDFNYYHNWLAIGY